jgi:phospholipid/cholesterol/gamma-HCH transport system ATP-binding protein
MSTMLSVRGLEVACDHVTLVEDVTFDVARGEVFAILGGNGSGKSTLLRLLAGLEVPGKGEIEVTGYGAPALQRGGPPPFGVMFQRGAVFGSMTVLDNVALPLEEWTSLRAEEIDVVARYKLRLVGIEEAADKMPSEISPEVTKRVAIARALALDATLLYFDEPGAGLDPTGAAELDDLILTLARTVDVTVVMVTSDLESAYRVADRCAILDQAERRILAIGDPRVLSDSSDPRVHAFFRPEPKQTRREWRPEPTM